VDMALHVTYPSLSRATPTTTPGRDWDWCIMDRRAARGKIAG
jgi:hypothetical protein